MQFFLDRHHLAMAECDFIPYRSSDYALVRLLIPALLCSGQLIPDTVLSFSSALAGASPLLN